MFNKKLKEQVEHQQNQINRLFKELDMIKNPPKFKVGQKIHNHLILERIYQAGDVMDLGEMSKYRYKVLKDDSIVYFTEQYLIDLKN